MGNRNTASEPHPVNSVAVRYILFEGGAAIIPQNYADVLPGTRHNFYLGLREFLDE